MTVKKQSGSKRKKIRVTDITPSSNVSSKLKTNKDDPKGGGSYSFTPAWPKKY